MIVRAAAPGPPLRPLLCGALLLAACVEAPVREPAERRAAVEPPRPGAGSAPALEVRFLDVGQGDAVLLRSGGKAALVDTGPSDRIVDQLRALGVDTLDLLVASHNHADHIGGADAILDAIPVRNYLDNGFPATTRIQERVLERVERAGVRYLAADRRTITLGGARIHVLPPPDLDTDEQNNRSVPLWVEAGSFRALLTGDSEIEELRALLERGDLPDVDLLKAAHHGSRDAVTPAWLAHTRPEVVVISLGADNPYGHPHAAALRYYCAGDRTVYRTDLQGEVVVRVDAGGAHTIETERGGAQASTCAPPGESSEAR